MRSGFPSVPRPTPLRRVTRALGLAVCLLLGLLALLGMGEAGGVAGLAEVLGMRRQSVALLAGHWQSDSGAVCPDGLREVDITLDVARRTAALLRRRGFRVQVYPEYAPELEGLRAGAFLAIHADSCVNLSGFKVARMSQAADADREDQLVNSLIRAYAEATGLPFHRDTITEDMRQYHALRRIAPETPGAIIELGFMGGDRELLTSEAHRVAVGLADGLTEFLRAQAAAPAVE